jgi:ABC-2 type transport system ATP-binding protein
MHKEEAINIIGLTKRFDASVRRITSSIELKNFLKILNGKTDKGIVALDDVNLSIKEGQVFGLLGPNGAGKTTLIKILSTLIIPDSGKVTVMGYDVVKSPRAVLRRLQAVLAEGLGFERRLTGRQNLEFYATLYGLSKQEARERADELLRFSGLESFADEMFQKYSTGMARKLLVCRALLTNASILLFDEPTSGLDPVSAKEFRVFLKDVLVRERGKTLLWATHNLWEAQEICDTIAVLNKGKVVAVGTPSEIRNKMAEVVSIRVELLNEDLTDTRKLEQIGSVTGVMSFEARNSVQDGRVILSIEAAKEVDYNSIFKIIISSGFRIAALEATQPSLEEAFIKLASR